MAEKYFLLILGADVPQSAAQAALCGLKLTRDFTHFASYAIIFVRNMSPHKDRFFYLTLSAKSVLYISTPRAGFFNKQIYLSRLEAAAIPKRDKLS